VLEKWFLHTLQEEDGFLALQNRVLKKIFGHVRQKVTGELIELLSWRD
jgi:hypothetical protein